MLRVSPARFLTGGECAACRTKLPASKLAVCQDCGARLCGEHIFSHRCPMPMEVF